MQMRRYGIPASVTLAQGILESSSRQSRLAVNENNHFGIKATPNGLPKVAGTVCIPMTSRTRSFAATTAWAIRYEHHSRFLKETAAMPAVFALAR